MSKIVFSQRVNRHILKMLDSNYEFESSFGNWQIPKSDNTGFDCPIGITKDLLSNIYICDSNNKRIVKLDSSLNFIGEFDFSNYGEPHQILFNSSNGDFYIVGIYKGIHLSIVRMSIDLIEVKGNKNIFTTIKEKPWGICKAFEPNSFLISIGKKLLKVIEAEEVSFVTKTDISKENVTNIDNTEITKHEVITKEKKYCVKNFPVLPNSYTFWRRYTETPIKNSTTEFQTKHFPLLEVPSHNPLNSIVVYKNEVELDFDSNLDDNNDYNINQNTGIITLAKPIINSDIIKIRYCYQMIENIDYTFDIMFGKLLLTEEVSEDHNRYRDIIECDYSYTGQCSEQTILGITENNTFITGLLKHSNNDIYIVQNTFSDYTKISRINSSYENVGDSNKISRFAISICERPDGKLLTYDSSNQKIVCYSENLNFIEEFYSDNYIKVEPPTGVFPNYQLNSFPILNKSEKVFSNSEQLPLNEYELKNSNGNLTILPITEEQVQVLTFGKNYQLNKFPIIIDSEQIYINNVLRTGGYTLDYSTGKLEFPEHSNFTIDTSITTNDIQTNLFCQLGDIVRFTSNIFPTNLQVNKDYFIIYQDGSKIQISETLNGAPIDFGSVTRGVDQFGDPIIVSNFSGKVFYKISGNVKAVYYRDIPITKVEYKTGLDIVDFSTFIIPETSNIVLATNFPYKIGEIINFREKVLGDLPDPIVKDTDYYIVEVIEKTEINPRYIKISNILEGSPITLTSEGFGQISYKYSGSLEKIENDTYDINSICELDI